MLLNVSGIWSTIILINFIFLTWEVRERKKEKPEFASSIKHFYDELVKTFEQPFSKQEGKYFYAQSEKRKKWNDYLKRKRFKNKWDVIYKKNKTNQAVARNVTKKNRPVYCTQSTLKSLSFRLSKLSQAILKISRKKKQRKIKHKEKFYNQK